MLSECRPMDVHKSSPTGYLLFVVWFAFLWVAKVKLQKVGTIIINLLYDLRVLYDLKFEICNLKYL